MKRAAVLFPWADLPRDMDLYGLMDRSKDRGRQAWGRVLCGTDEQIGTALVQYLPDLSANFNLPPQAHIDFSRSQVINFERIMRREFEHTKAWREFACGYHFGMAEGARAASA